MGAGITGALVCFRNDGRLLMVVQHDRHWMLEAVSGAPLGILHNPDGTTRHPRRGLPCATIEEASCWLRGRESAYTRGARVQRVTVACRPSACSRCVVLVRPLRSGPWGECSATHSRYHRRPLPQSIQQRLRQRHHQH
jgi:hypothetical protein